MFTGCVFWGCLVFLSVLPSSLPSFLPSFLPCHAPSIILQTVTESGAMGGAKDILKGTLSLSSSSSSQRDRWCYHQKHNVMILQQQCEQVLWAPRGQSGYPCGRVRVKNTEASRLLPKLQRSWDCSHRSCCCLPGAHDLDSWHQRTLHLGRYSGRSSSPKVPFTEEEPQTQR